MFKSLLLLGGLVCSIGLGVNNVPVSNDLHYETNETIELKANPKLLSIDDIGIRTFSSDELNNFTWTNFFTAILDYRESEDFSSQDMAGSYIVYNGNNYGIDEYVDFQSYSFVGDDAIIYLDFVSNKFQLYIYSGDYEVASDFESSLVLHTEDLTTSLNTALNSALQLDISANSESMPQASDLFGYITQGATQFASALGQAFTSITAMIWDSTNSAPTFLGMVLLLSIGAGLIYLAFNIIRGLVRRLRG